MGWLGYLLPRRRRTGTAETFQTAMSRLSDYEDEDRQQQGREQTNEKSEDDLIKREFGFHDSCELGHFRMHGDGETCTSPNDATVKGSEWTPIAPALDKTGLPIGNSSGKRSTKSYLGVRQACMADNLTSSLKSMQLEVATITAELTKLLDSTL